MTTEEVDTGTKVENMGFDWFTVTQVEAEQKDNLWASAQVIRLELSQDGEEEKPWRSMGYEGFAFGPLKYGERGVVEAIMILSGDAAARFGFRDHVSPDRVTRADLQVTIRFDKPVKGVAAKVHASLQEKFEGNLRRPFVALLQDVTGDTVYVGKRAANVSVRLYDKSIQMGEQETGICWRYEVQYRRKAAKEAVRRVFDQPEPNLAVLGLVAAEFEKKGVQAKFGSGTEVSAIEVGRTLTTTEGSIAWLEKCVAPVISRLVLDGHEEAVINALNLGAVMRFIKDGEKWQ